MANAANVVVYPNTRDSISFVTTEDDGTESLQSYNLRGSRFFEAGNSQMYGHRAYFTLRFDAPVSPDEIDSSPYDPYLKKWYDIHLAGKPALPDSRNPEEPVGFRDVAGYPWALLVPKTWKSSDRRKSHHESLSQLRFVESKQRSCRYGLVSVSRGRAGKR